MFLALFMKKFSEYMHELWQEKYWVNPQNNRYYRIVLQQNLFAEWVIIKIWGTLHTKLGNTKTYLCSSYEDALEKASQIAKQRTRKKYIAVVAD